MYNVNCQRLIPKCPENTMKMIFRKVGNPYNGLQINCFVQMIVDIFHHLVDTFEKHTGYCLLIGQLQSYLFLMWNLGF